MTVDLVRELEVGKKESARLREENERLRALLGMPRADEPPLKAPIEVTLFPTREALPEVDVHSPMAGKVALLRSLFRARDDVYALR